jgi:tripartite-type tricarboxylate transporter receptor subunit TctC
MNEHGVTGFPTEVWFGLLAPAGTPAAVVGRLNQALNAGLNSSEVRVALAKLGVEGRNGTPQDFAVALSVQARTWRAVVEATGIKVE